MRTILLLFIISVPTFVVSISPVTGELPHNMPIVYVDPEYSAASGETIFNVTVKVFNLTNNLYSTDGFWKFGARELPPPGTRYNYTLGNLYGFRVRLSWNPLVLECLSHVIKTPVEDYPDGVLHGPLLVVQGDLNSSAGTFSVSQNSWYYPVAGFNCPDKNATMFVLSFRVKREEPCYLRLEYVELIPDPRLAAEGVSDTIPLLALNGAFIPENTTLVTAMTVGVIVGTQLFTPVILGEEACVRFTMKNEGRVVDSYNLTLYQDSAPVETWKNESLASGESKAYNFTIETEGLALGLHTLAVEASIIHRGTPLVHSSDISFILIHGPSMSVGQSTSDVYENETVVLNAFEDVNLDPNVEIRNFTWLLYEPGAVSPGYSYEGESVTHQFAKNGTWRIVLLVEDNWKISYNPSRNATKSYMEEVLLDVQSGEKPSTVEVFTPEQIALVVLLTSFALLSVTLYVMWKRRVRL